MKHPGTGASSLQLPNEPHVSPKATPSDSAEQSVRSRRSSTVRNEHSTAEEQLTAKGFIPIQWYGKCEADKVTVGTYAVGPGNGGMFGLVFDNTFSKAISKTATFVLLTYPSNAPPNTTYHNLQGAPGAKATALTAPGLVSKSSSQNLRAAANESVDSLHSHSRSISSRGTSAAGKGPEPSKPTFHVGELWKRRRKRGQGYAKRYFSLDFVSCTLSYYHNRNSSALRGAIPLSLAAIAADERRREISIDSGAEVWHLKAGNAKNFEEWTKALEAASNKARGNVPDEVPTKTGRPGGLHVRTNSMYKRPTQPPSREDLEWEQVESLVSRIVGTRDAVRRLVKEPMPPHKQAGTGRGHGPATGSSAVHEEEEDYFSTPTEKRPFWRRKASSNTVVKRGARSSSISAQLGPSIATQLSPGAPAVAPIITNNQANIQSMRSQPIANEDPNIHKHCEALLKDLDVVLAEFNSLITRSKRRRFPPVPISPVPRRSMDSASTGEFYDAEGGDGHDSHLLVMNRISDEDTPLSDTPLSDHDEEFVSGDDATSISSEIDEVRSASKALTFFPPKPKSLAPLPIKTKPQRRTTVKPSTVLPPSLISFLRKNVGKDLSTISMPVSANEPTSALQRLAENMEYAELLDAAAQHPSPQHRHLLVSAFAISCFSSNRARERAIRKPFNPMLGETFELVRAEPETPGNFRFVAEKVCHRPVKMACQADSPWWSYTHSSTPTQKFWGKSAELITEGRVHVVLRLADGGADECYSWPIATMFLRNVVIGEKYVEPVGTVSVLNETSGAAAAVEFKSKGMFGGRSEDVEVALHDAAGADTGLGLAGTWTAGLRATERGRAREEVWRAGALVKGAETRYGFTAFAATLNEITEIERGRMAATDSRLRPDQRAAEDAELDRAEELKGVLEERQRERRREMEARGEEWRPRWFERAEGGEGECWRLRTGGKGYWEERSRGVWEGVEDVFALEDAA